ncbi:MAG: acetate--CoA ligase family protein, partial [Acidobacteriota bacterium]|nr:acetate--CoA ligase family protein [Acidobacteriota bacterium]
VLSEIGAVVNSETDKPVLSVMMATEDFYDEVKLRPELPPVYRFPETAARALAQLSRYATWRRRPEDEPVPEFAVDDEEIDAILARSQGGYLPSRDALRILESYGIPVTPWRWADDASAAETAAAELGFPVAIKAEAAGLIHKSDAGAVRLDLDNSAQVGRAIGEIESALAGAGFAPSGFLLQRMASGGHEVLFGISTDPRFGPLLAFGLGGRYVEVFSDVRFGVAPLSASEARAMIEGIRGFPLLKGVRGEAGADLDVLLDVLLRVAQLSKRHPRIIELDINPFFAAAQKARAVAVDVRIRLADV